MAEPWLINPPSHSRRRRKSSKRRTHTMARKRKKYTKQRRKSTRKSRKVTISMNPRKRYSRRKRSYTAKRRRRSYRNPPRVMGRGGVGMDIAYAGAGYLGTKIFGNMTANLVAPMMGMLGTDAMPIMRMALKGGTAWLVAWAWEVFMRDKRHFTPIFLGGFMSVVEDAVDTWIVPMAPGLLGDDLSIYPGLTNQNMGVYPQLPYGGNGGYANGSNMGADVNAPDAEFQMGV